MNIFSLSNQLLARPMRLFFCLLGVLANLSSPPLAAEKTEFNLGSASLADIHAAMEAGALSAERLVELYLARIEAYDKQGPSLNSVFFLNENAMEEARALDVEWRALGPRGPLHGIPVVVKDLVDVKGLPTTGGFKPFGMPLPAQDATIVKKIREAGGIILAKVATTNWYGNGFDDTHFHGPTRNPHNPAHLPGSSSNGTGASMAAWFAAVGIGTDTGGSVMIPSAHSGLAGVVATQGLVSRAGIMPRGATQDRAGPMGRSVYDITVLLAVIAGWDADDLITFDGLNHFPSPDWASSVAEASLPGMRIGVLREMVHNGSEYEEGRVIFEEAISALRAGGAQVVDPILSGLDLKVLATSAVGRTAEYEKIAMQNAYLARFGSSVPYRTIQEMMAALDDDLFSPAMHSSLLLEAPDRSDTYLARARLRKHLRSVITELCDKHDFDALVFPFSLLPPATIEAPIRGEGRSNALSSNNGLPSVIVPAGYSSSNLPIGLQFIGKPYSDLSVLKAAAAYEKSVKPLRLPDSTPALPGERFSF
jgi:amidase